MKTTRPKSARRTKQPVSASPPERFFQKELGEEAPFFQTMQTLFHHAAMIQGCAPWTALEENNLVVVAHPVTQQPLFVSVMGAAGEARAVQVYIGLESYSWFLKVHSQNVESLGEYLSHQNSVFVSYCTRDEITPADRRLAKTMGHPLTPRLEVPQFRTIRPGYHPWFVTESEAQALTAGLEAVLVVCEACSRNPSLHPWNRKDRYPSVKFTQESGDRAYTMSSVVAPVETAKMPVLPDLDLNRIEKIFNREFPSSGTLELDHFYNASARIGGKHERKACMRIALAVDAKTLLAFAPLVSNPEDSTGNMLQQVVLGAIETKRAIPVEIHVRDREFKILLAPLAEKLGFAIKVRAALPALDFARHEMEAMLRNA